MIECRTSRGIGLARYQGRHLDSNGKNGSVSVSLLEVWAPIEALACPWIAPRTRGHLGLHIDWDLGQQSCNNMTEDSPIDLLHLRGG
jgi:hypothetical protein